MILKDRLDKFSAKEMASYLNDSFCNKTFYVERYNEKPFNKKPSYAYRIAVDHLTDAEREAALEIINDVNFM